jgi:soluble lytic murein transglycosylase-like protein
MAREATAALSALLTGAAALASLNADSYAARPSVQEPQKADRFDGLILKYSQRRRLDPRLVKSIIATESSFRSRVVSPMGAVGLMQIMPATAASLGTPPDRLTDPEANIRAGTAYLDLLFHRADRWYGLDGSDRVRPPRWVVRRVLAGYHAGPRGLRAGSWHPRTQDYVQNVLRCRDAGLSSLRHSKI